MSNATFKVFRLMAVMLLVIVTILMLGACQPRTVGDNTTPAAANGTLASQPAVSASAQASAPAGANGTAQPTKQGQTEDEALQEGRSSGGFAAGNTDQSKHSTVVPTLLPGDTNYRDITNPTVDPATAGQPQVIPHTLTDRSECLACHKTGVGGAPKVPQDHIDAGMPNNLCQTCHVASSGSTTPTAKP